MTETEATASAGIVERHYHRFPSMFAGVNSLVGLAFSVMADAPERYLPGVIGSVLHFLGASKWLTDRSHLLAQSAFMVAGFFWLIPLMLTEGADPHPATMALWVVPMSAYAFCDRRVWLPTLSFTVIFYLCFYAALLAGVQFPSLTPPELEPYWSAMVVLFGGIYFVVCSASHTKKIRALTDDLSAIAAEANEARASESRFLSNMSHEIRNPLNGIIGMLDALRESPRLDSADEETLRTARHASTHLLDIVNDVLDLKKIQEGQLTLNIQSVDMTEVTRPFIATFRSMAEEKGIEFRETTEFANPELPRFLFIDPKLFTQINVNLSSNAIKFTEEGSVTNRGDYKDGCIVLTYVDTGIGMAPETVRTLFQRFRQAEDGTAKAYGGTGLGLSITHEIVTLMGGTIEVESELGKGSRFTVRIPAEIDHEREAAWREGRLTEVNTEQSGKIDLSGQRILCVDDSNINLKVVSRPLIKAGASVTTALSAYEALDLIRAAEFDIVLTDISMPEMDGEQLQQQLSEWKVGLPVVAITGNVLDSDVKRYLASGFVAALAKPVDVSELLRIVAQHGKKAVSA